MFRNPLLQREFRQRMRTLRAPTVITGYLLAMVFLTFFLLYENLQGQTLVLLTVRSEQIFVAVSWLQMTIAAFLTPAFAAGSVSGERERRTLPVLMTTPLSPLGIILGKILSSSLLIILLLVVTLPVYSLVFLFGGAVPQEAVSVFLFQLFTIFVIAAISVMFSSIALQSAWSTVLSYGWVSFMILVTGVIGYGLRFLGARSPIDPFSTNWSTALLNLNPLWVEGTLENAITGSPGAWVTFVVFYSAVCVILVIPCVIRLRPQDWSLDRFRRKEARMSARK